MMSKNMNFMFNDVNAITHNGGDTRPTFFGRQNW